MRNHVGRVVDAVKFAAQLPKDEAFPVTGRFRVTTRTGSVYLIDDDAQTIAKNDEPPRPGFVQGATFGGSMLMPGRLLTDAYMEFVLKDVGTYGESFRTSLVVSIEVTA